MHLKIVSLNLADRLLIDQFMANFPEAITQDIAATLREVRKRFEIRNAQKEIKALRPATPAETEEAEQITWDELSETLLKKFTIDDNQLIFLQSKLEKHDWNPLTRGARNGGFVQPAMISAIADLADHLADAQLVKKE